jgi:hypothetical protein
MCVCVRAIYIVYICTYVRGEKNCATLFYNVRPVYSSTTNSDTTLWSLSAISENVNVY